MKNLEEFDRRGWIVGPEETKEAFLKRIEALDHFYHYPPQDVDHFLTTRDWTKANEILRDLYDFSQDWMVSFYSDKNLSFFQGAATWITEKGDYRIPLVQLKKKFEEGSIFKIYGKSEVLAHEAVHAARMQFDEPHFEEIFAYKTSPYFLRRFFGPLFEKPWEAYLLIALAFLPFVIEILRLIDLEISYFHWLPLAPIGFFGLLFGRLIFFRLTLFLCMKSLKLFLKNPRKKWAVCARMKDREIFQFAYHSKKTLSAFLSAEKSLRWQLLKEMYFKK